jgi:hypothetical protein
MSQGQQSLTFVVSTGSCGSTMLSRLLCQHPEVLSLSEFFTVLRAAIRRGAIPAEDMDGQRLWQMLSEPDPFGDRLLRALKQVPEFGGVGYAYQGGRFNLETGVPRICHSVLPLLTDDPDDLFDQLAAEVPTWPSRPAAGQYRALFGYLSSTLRRRAVVERSGGSIRHVAALQQMFPEARFVHLHRDGPDCALSMSRPPGGQLAGLHAEAARAAGLSPSTPWKDIHAAMNSQFERMLSEQFDLKQFMSYQVPLTFYGQRWSSMLCTGLPVLAAMPPSCWISIKYEEILNDPGPQLRRLADFLGVEAVPSWLASASGMVDLSRAGASARLDPGSLAALRQACDPGAQAIADAEARRLAAAGQR